MVFSAFSAVSAVNTLTLRKPCSDCVALLSRAGKSGTIPCMRRLFFVALVLLLVASCHSPGQPVTILDGGEVFSVLASGDTPREWLQQAGRSLGPDDRLFYLGLPVDPDRTLPTVPGCVLSIRRAVLLTLVTPDGTRSIRTAAFSVGQALTENGTVLYAGDRLTPPAGSPIVAPMMVTYVPSREVIIRVGEQSIKTRTAAETVGAALVEAGIPPQGLDEPLPAESEPLPADGQIRLRRVYESLVIQQESVPYTTETQFAPDQPLGWQEMVQAGEPGLALGRVRIRYADGQEVSRQIDEMTVVRPPKAQVVRSGSKVVVETVNVNGQKLEVWRVLDMYATVYSPCNSGTGGCSYGTASGLRAGKGVVAVDPALYAYLQGQRVYIPGYGFGVIGDVGGGYIIENTLGISRYRWIDLGFDDNNLQDLTGWVKVYFLAPAPASIPAILQ
jgi:uncharacterized protein YabE (DUF348 family)